MKLSERVLDAMSGIDEKLLKDSEEYTYRKQTFDFRILAMTMAVLLFAVIVIPRMPKSGSAAPAAAERTETYEAVNDAEYPSEAAETDEEKSTSASEYGAYGLRVTDELQEALQTQQEITIIAEPAEELNADTLRKLCAELQTKGYEAYEEEGKLLIRIETASFEPEILPAEYDWLLDIYD